MKKYFYQLKNKARYKRGIIIGDVIFIILNVAFFAMLLYFVRDRCLGENIKEKILTRQIALLINSAEPETLLIFNVQEYLKIAKENKIQEQDFIKIEDGLVSVALNGDKSNYPFFSDYKIEYELRENFLYVKIK
ncbi:MAG: hypothetical protein QXF25_01635 [Candidatus Pacearchaeota archaeon]